MPDHNFHKRSAALTLEQIIRLTGAELSKGSDPSVQIKDVAPLETAGSGDLTFLDNVKYKDQFARTKAAACIVRPELAALAPKGIHLLLSAVPYKAYALAAQAFYPDTMSRAHIASGAVIDSSAQLGEGCVIEEGAVIGAHVKLGKQCHVGANVVIGNHVTIGDHGRIGANAVLSHALIGAHVRIYPGVCIGQDGFGFAPDPKGHVKVPQLGRVMIEDHVEIGANSTVDRGSGPDTVIGQGTWIDNMVQIAHNVKIGRGCMIAAQCGIAGSTVIGDFTAMGGQVGVSGHLVVGKNVRIAAKSGVTRNIPDGEEYMGYPAMPMKQYLRGVALLNRLIKKEKSS
jgi:UDP-3-O-[3-hydroxymyristoyl] glucosamine N-acyltransferase